MATKATSQAQAKTKSQPEHPYRIGQGYFVRTVTMYFTGRLMAVYPQELVFEEAAWIADTGRFKQALESGVFNEVEPYPDQVIIGRGAIIDISTFAPALPRNQK